MDCYICDIDGTIADTEHRIHYITNGHKDWNNWFAHAHKDEPISGVIQILDLASAAGIKILLCTARDEMCRPDTIEWLEEHKVPYDGLYMRKKGDRRDDDIVKFEMLEQIYELGYNPLLVFDDRDRVVKMWRAAGLRCLQVAPGDF